MLGRLFLLFTAIPLLELWLLMRVSEVVGLPMTIATVLSTGALGAALARREGTRALSSWRDSLAQGELPKEGIASGLLILVGGIFLVTPGVLTDVAGLMLLIPPIRRAFANALVQRAGQSLHVQHFQHFPPESAADPRRPGEVIDVDGHFHQADPPHDVEVVQMTPSDQRMDP